MLDDIPELALELQALPRGEMTAAGLGLYKFMDWLLSTFGEGRPTKKDIKAFAQMIASLEFFLGKNRNESYFADISDVGYKFKAEQKKEQQRCRNRFCV
jgi:hypothetical protein